ncbi:hypothetical protein XA26_06100 [Mycolicibacterium fortuitum]|uniref:Helix-turn-helix domain-containing protein n=1 Tax=Mycolicibacterium fortuitum TaxID=1766 RepID=A0A0N7H7V4_MYCFO|nr:winged helix-turn-helix domain-containing protein [Mycolicibacterium fortuitum]ALI24471.1 hypothetical protein XA26_06100 [Mycolicibacterium fortuitum]
METNETTQPMNREDAELLDKQICEAVENASDDLAVVFDLLEEAKNGETHKAFGFTSWTAYAADRLKPIVAVLSDAKRRELIAYLYDEEMSVRDTADTLGISKSTAGRAIRDVSRNGTPVSNATTGHDGKRYRRKESTTNTARRGSITRTARDLLKIAKRFEELGTTNRLAELDALDLMVIGDQLLEANATVHAAWLAVEELT